MAWTGWLAAIGGVLVAVELLGVDTGGVLSWIGTVAAVVFGLWGALSD